MQLISPKSDQTIEKIAFIGLLALSDSVEARKTLEELLRMKPELEETFLSSPLYLALHKPAKEMPNNK